jgi:hypothetical protein
LFLLLLCGYGTPRAQNVSTHRPPVYIGFLDDAREEMVNWKPGVSRDRLVRPAFQRTDAGWASVDPKSFPTQMRWTVAFDGKVLGQLQSRSWSESFSSKHLTFVQSILASPLPIPNVGRPKSEYAPLGMGPTQGRRPLVLVSQPYVSDPYAWGPLVKPPIEIASAVRKAYRRDFPHVNRCVEEKIVQRDWKFPDSALRTLDTYRSNKDSYLVHVSLEAGDCGYVDDPNDALSSPWYFLPATGSAKRIGSFMTLLDAGDYDNDGRSEVIFMVEQPEDTEGFALFDADMRERAKLLWTYH